MNVTEWISLIGAVAAAVISIIKAQQARGHAARARASETHAQMTANSLYGQLPPSAPPVPDLDPAVPPDTAQG